MGEEIVFLLSPFSRLILTLGKRGTGLKNEFARRPSIHILL